MDKISLHYNDKLSAPYYILREVYNSDTLTYGDPEVVEVFTSERLARRLYNRLTFNQDAEDAEGVLETPGVLDGPLIYADVLESSFDLYSGTLSFTVADNVGAVTDQTYSNLEDEAVVSYTIGLEAEDGYAFANGTEDMSVDVDVTIDADNIDQTIDLTANTVALIGLSNLGISAAEDDLRVQHLIVTGQDHTLYISADTLGLDGDDLVDNVRLQWRRENEDFANADSNPTFTLTDNVLEASFDWGFSIGVPRWFRLEYPGDPTYRSNEVQVERTTV